jgi:starch-binding outer membrane protein, SusD/RagB family
MKKKLLSLLLLGGALITSSCDESKLEIKPTNSYDESTYFTGATQLNEAIVAAYATFLQPGMYSREWYFTFDCLGNDAERAPALLGDLVPFTEYNFDGSNNFIQLTWLSLYRMVFRANFAIEKLEAWNPSLDSEKALKNQYIAEAKFLRGYGNFQLVNLWGRVPLKMTRADHANFYQGRTDVATIWAAVEKDFTEASAAGGLPIKYDSKNTGRATLGAAKAMLGKALLYQKKYAAAETVLTEIQGANYGYSLVTNFESLFQSATVSTPESIFYIPHKYHKDLGGNQWYTFAGQEAWGGKTTHTGRGMEYGFNDWNNLDVSDALVASYSYTDEAGKAYVDPRGKFTFYGDPAKGGDADFCNTCAAGKLDYDFKSKGNKWKKYCEYESVKNVTTANVSEINSQVIRFADVLYMAAEAKIMQGKVAEALPLINKVRARAGAFEYKSLGAQADAMKIIRRERQMELAGEQSRYFDLVRWGDLVPSINAEKNAVRVRYSSIKENPLSAKNALLPLPNSEVQFNPAVGGDLNTTGWN